MKDSLKCSIFQSLVLDSAFDLTFHPLFLPFRLPKSPFSSPEIVFGQPLVPPLPKLSNPELKRCLKLISRPARVKSREYPRGVLPLFQNSERRGLWSGSGRANTRAEYCSSLEQIHLLASSFSKTSHRNPFAFLLLVFL